LFSQFLTVLWEENTNKASAASMKSLTNCEKDPSSNPLQGACSGSPIAACDTKKFFRKPHVIRNIVLKAGHECTFLYIGESRTMRAKKSLNRNLQLLKEFLEKKPTETLYFPLERGRLKVKITLAHLHKYSFIMGLQTNILLVTQSL
jgi:hypothetical protein